MITARIAAAALVVLLGLAGADPAHALTASRSGTELRIQAGAAEWNVATATQNGSKLRVSDIGTGWNGVGSITKTAGPGCAMDGDAVTCSTTGATRLTVDLGDGQDSFDAVAFDGSDPVRLALVVHGGPGDDRFRPSPVITNEFRGGDGNDSATGGPLGDRLFGDDGFDMLDGGAGNDAIDGGAGGDELDGSAGTDVVEGGAGEDQVRAFLGGPDVLSGGPDGPDRCRFLDPDGFSWLQTAVNLSLDDLANDGPAVGTRTANVRGDCEGLTGGTEADTLTGNNGPNSLSAAWDNSCTSDRNRPRDVIHGLGGDDDISLDNCRGGVVAGGAGSDRITSGIQDDEIDGGTEDDTVLYPGYKRTVASLADRSGGRPEYDERDTFMDVEGLGGSEDDDVLIGDGADNVLLGGPAGEDQLDGGSGQDTADLRGRWDDLVIDLATQTAERLDSEFGASITRMSSIEHARGGDGDDVLLGDDAPNRLSGGYGDDLLDGGPGADHLDGEAGEDEITFDGWPIPVIIDIAAGRATARGEQDILANVEAASGSSHDDTLIGSAGDEYLAGGAGDDTIDGGAGGDMLLGEAGWDRIQARDGVQDDVVCADGIAVVDAADFVRSCSLVSELPPISTPNPPPGSPPSSGSPRPPLTRPAGSRPISEPGDLPRPALRVRTDAVRSMSRQAFRRGGLRLRIHCSQQCRARTEIYPDGGGRRLVRTTTNVAADRWITIRLRPPRRGAGLARRTRALSIELRLTSSAGDVTRATRMVALRAP